MFVSPETMKLLLELEIPAEKLVELFQRLDDDARMMMPPPPVRSRNADRQQKFRDKRAAEADVVTEGVTNNVTRNVTDPSPCPETKVFPEPLSKTQTLTPPHPPIVPPPLSLVENLTSGQRATAFDAWYSRFPNKVGRAAAEKAFRQALTKTTLDVLLIAADEYVANKPIDRPWCNPATWLNQERWLDRPAPAAAKQKRVSWV